MKLSQTAVAVVMIVSSAAPVLAQSTPNGAGQQVNPGTNPGAVGEAAKFGMNNGGSPADGSGLHGGKTVNPGLKK